MAVFPSLTLHVPGIDLILLLLWQKALCFLLGNEQVGNDAACGSTIYGLTIYNSKHSEATIFS